MSGYELTELNRRLANVVTIGRVVSVDYAKATARVEIGENQTAELPMRAGRAGGNRSWEPVEVGEQVIVISPSGNLSTGLIMGSLYSDEGAAPGDRPGLQRTTYSGGSVIEFDRDANHFTMNLAGGSVTINAPGGITITGNVTVTGDVIADGISLKQHRHGGVVPGGAQTGVPQ